MKVITQKKVSCKFQVFFLMSFKEKDFSFKEIKKKSKNLKSRVGMVWG